MNHSTIRPVQGEGYMTCVQIEYHDAVALLKLNRGVTNALNLQMIEELSEGLQQIKSNPQVKGIVLTSTNTKFFCIGYDLTELYNISRNDFTVFYKAFNRFCLDLYTVPKPTVAAVTGHAIAGGCALTLCCDYRYIAEGRKLMGFNVVKIGIPVPYVVNCLLLNLVGYRKTRDIAESGEFFEPEQLLEMGMVDEIVPENEVIEKAREKVTALGTLPEKAYAVTKLNRIEQVKHKITEHLEEKENYFIECWSSPETQKLIKKAMEKF
jgi:enoyl-CoA hydratase/carnithine racemase